ncbi:MAG: glycosyltransferase [Candidatus Delongbacteria bacterium]|nr:glycosyltransferase [Candidatus Delongbacteria bacterium]
MKQISIFFPIYENNQPIYPVLAALDAQSAKNFQVILADFRSQPEPLKLKDYPFVKLANLPLSHRSKTFNQIIQQYGGDVFMPLAPYIIPGKDFIRSWSIAFDNPQAAMVYSNYMLVEGATAKKVDLFDWEGQVEERFDYGFVKAFDISKMKEVGLYDEKLEVMEEYDLWLKLTDHYKITHISEFSYDAIKPAQTMVEDDISQKLFSPGGKGLGQFSYLFYPPKMEIEVKEVFYNKLKRLGAYIENPTVAVPYPAQPYPLLASVVIPVYNRVKYIGHAVKRVLEGTFKAFEVIVVDNGSTDGTQDTVSAITDPRVRLIRNNGKCIADALNRGIREAKGKYICQLDSDDEYTPDTLETMVAHLESHPKCGLAISYYEVMDESGTPMPELGVIEHLEYDRNNIIRVDGAGALRVFPKIVLEEFGLYDEINFGNFGEDYDMVLKVSEKYDVDRVHKVLYRYRRHSDNTDVTRDPIMKVRNKLKSRLNAIQRRKAINNR